MEKMKIGFTSTTFRQIRSVEKIVEIAKKAGVSYIEWGGDIHVKTVEEAKKVKALCDRAGISICSYGSYYTVGSGKTQEWKRICLIASTMGAQSVRVWLGNKDSEKTGEAEYAGMLSDAKAICDEAALFSLKVCPECHDGTFNNSTDAILKFISDLKKDNFGTYFQSRYRRLAYDLDRIDRTFEFTENVHVSFSECVREQFFSVKNGHYADMIVSEYARRGFDGVMLLEYTFFAGEKYLINDIRRIRGNI